MSKLIDPVVVAFDGSADAKIALDWGISTALLKAGSLRAILVDPVHRIPGVILPGAGAVDEAVDYARETLENSPLEKWRLERIEGVTEAVLLKAAKKGNVLVVGSKGHGRLSGALLGSISQYLIRHAAVPVVVVRPTVATKPTGIVVGVDGSTGSRAALEFACSRAEWTGESVLALHGWPLGDINVSRSGDLPDSVVAKLAEHDRMLTEEIAGLATDHPDVALTHEAIPVAPARVLVDASTDASLVVVGASGHGAVHDTLLGSVCQEVVERAHCPVAVAR